MTRTRISILAVSMVAALIACAKPGEICAGNDYVTNEAQACVSGGTADGGTMYVGFGQEFNTGTFIGTSAPSSIAIRNGGIADLTIEAATPTGDTAFTYVADWDTEKGDREIPGTSIKGKQSAFITIYFAPTQAKAYSGELVLKTNGGKEPVRTIVVSGCGVPADGGASPCLCAEKAKPCTRNAACCSGMCAPIQDGGVAVCQ